MSEVADFIVSLGPNGHAVAQGNISDALRFNTQLQAEVNSEKTSETKALNPTNESKVTDEARFLNGKLVVAEDIALGHVQWPALKLFFSALGGPGFWVFYLVGFVLANMVILLQTYWLG